MANIVNPALLNVRTPFLCKGDVLERLVENSLRREIDKLKKRGEPFPVVVFVDDQTDLARKLKKALPDDGLGGGPGVMGVYDRQTVRSVFDPYYAATPLFDYTEGANPDTAYFCFDLVGSVCGILDLIDLRDGKEIIIHHYEPEI